MQPPLFLALVVAAVWSATAYRETDGARPAAQAVCALEGWSADTDPAGLHVRAGPWSRARIIGRLPPPEPSADFDRAFAVEFEIVEARNGWFRIRNAHRWSEPHDAPSRLPSGWISGRFVDFALQTDRAFASPDPSSPVVATAWRDAQGSHALRHRHPSDCRGEWVRLMVTGHDGREREAWVRGVCGIQETTCDGVQGDQIDDEALPEL